MSLTYHFEDCPYGCNSNGKILDTISGELIPCPHCFKKIEAMVKESRLEIASKEAIELPKELGIDQKFLTGNFVYDTIIPSGELLFIDKESVDFQREEAENLYKLLILGEKPKYSVCFGLGIKGRVDYFVYPMLATAYRNGLTVSKFVSAYMFTRMVLKQDDALDELYNADIVFMLFNDGCTNADVSNANGLMKTRAVQGKPTVFVTNWSIEGCSGLLSSLGEEPSLFQAKPVFVKYAGVKKQSPYILSILGASNEEVSKEMKSGKYTRPTNEVNRMIGVENGFLEQTFVQDEEEYLQRGISMQDL